MFHSLAFITFNNYVINIVGGVFVSINVVSLKYQVILIDYIKPRFYTRFLYQVLHILYSISLNETKNLLTWRFLHIWRLLEARPPLCHTLKVQWHMHHQPPWTKLIHQNQITIRVVTIHQEQMTFMVTQLLHQHKMDNMNTHRRHWCTSCVTFAFLSLIETCWWWIDFFFFFYIHT